MLMLSLLKFVFIIILNNLQHHLHEQRWNVFGAERAGQGGMPSPRPLLPGAQSGMRDRFKAPVESQPEKNKASD